MGHLCGVELPDKLDKFGNIDVLVDDMNSENPGIRIKTPAKIVKNDMVDDGNDDMDIKEKSDRIRRDAMIREHLRIDTVENQRAKSAPQLLKLNEDRIRRAAKMREHLRIDTEDLKTKSAPQLLKLNERPPLDMKFTEKSWNRKSLVEKLAWRRNNPNPCDQFAVEVAYTEREAKSYMNELQDNTIGHLRKTCSTLETIIQKENDTMEELKRQDKVVKQANRYIHATGEDLNDTDWRLKGMQSTSNKLENMFRKKPKHCMSPQICTLSKELENGYRRRFTTPIKLPSQRCGNKSNWINEEVNQINHLLGKVEYKVIELGHELKKQETALHRLEQNIDQIGIKIPNQTKLISSLTRK